jgi:methylated-DNA-[protein]-cysteine S-methyltransferase
MKKTSITFPIATPHGSFTAVYTENGLAALKFPNGKNRPASDGQKISPKVRNWHRATGIALKKFFAGQESKLPPLDLAGTEFQKSVWRELRKIPRGSTKSYGEIAQAIGRPKAVRAVGGACGANPLPLFVPCHRVLAANKKIGGFGGGLDWKRKLLAQEGIAL